jgi:hypothetical protein
MTPGDAEYEAKMQADIARLQAAKGVQVRQWLRQNRTLVIVFAVYFTIIGASMAVGVFFFDAPPGLGILIGAFVVPLMMLRIWIKIRR